MSQKALTATHEPTAFDALNLALQDVFEPDNAPLLLNEDYGYGDLAVDIMAGMRKHGFDVGALLSELEWLRNPNPHVPFDGRGA